MGQVTITINARTYRLECGDGEEPHLLELADKIGRHVDELAQKFGQVGDERLLLMAGLTIADELWETRRKLADAKAELEAGAAGSGADNPYSEVTDRIDDAVSRIQALSAQLSEPPPPGGTD